MSKILLKPEGRIFLKPRPSARELATKTQRPGVNEQKITRPARPAHVNIIFPQYTEALLMGQSLSNILTHTIFSTKDRQSFIHDRIELRLYGYIKRMKSRPCRPSNFLLINPGLCVSVASSLALGLGFKKIRPSGFNKILAHREPINHREVLRPLSYPKFAFVTLLLDTKKRAIRHDVVAIGT